MFLVKNPDPSTNWLPFHFHSILKFLAVSLYVYTRPRISEPTLALGIGAIPAFRDLDLGVRGLRVWGSGLKDLRIRGLGFRGCSLGI